MAPEIIHLFSAAVERQLGAEALRSMIYAHPTVSEVCAFF